MPDLLMPYLVSLVTTIVVILIACWAYFISHRSAIRYIEQEKELDEQKQKLPEATRWADLRYRVGDLQKQHDALASALAEAQTTIEQATRDRDWLEKHRDEVASARVVFEQMEERNAKLADLNDQIANKTEALLKLEIDAAKAEFHRINAEEKAIALEEQAEKLAKSLESMEQRSSHAQQRIDEVQGKLDEIRDEYDRVRVDLAATAKQLAESKIELESLNKELETLKERRAAHKETLSNMLGEHQELEQQRGIAKVDIKALEHRRKQLEDNVQTLFEDRVKVAPEMQGAESALKSLWDPVLKHEQFPGGFMDDPKEDESLDKVRQYLKSLDLRFGDRVIDGSRHHEAITRRQRLAIAITDLQRHRAGSDERKH